MRTIAQLDARYYAHHLDGASRLDGTVRRYLKSQQTLLDLGAGRGERFSYDYKSWVRLVVGVDLSERIRNNSNIHQACIGDVARLPFRDEAFDLVLARFVFEHLRDPGSAFRELRRVLKPGGHVVFHTPNRFHYFVLAARATPHRFHVWFNSRRGWREHDVHETFYRANDRFTIGRMGAQVGFMVRELSHFEIKPEYLSFHPAAYCLGIVYERVVNRFAWLRDLRSNMVGVLEAV